MIKLRARVIGPMPAFYKVAHAIWGSDTDFDSDGDSYNPESTDWRELSLTRRPEYDLRVDIDPAPEDRNIVTLRSESEELVQQVLVYLESCGSIARLDPESAVRD